MSFKPDVQRLFNEYSQELRLAAERDILRLETLINRCESPLEQIFLITFTMSLIVTGPIMLDGETNHITFPISGKKDDYFLSIILYPQHEIKVDDKVFRADFFISVTTSHRFNHKEVMSIVVEIDGHDFHEKTKEQARRDRARDRLMTKKGYIIFRYTGTEVHHQANQVVDEIILFIYDQLEKRGI